ncbi:MAG: XRE family transcriptional regulator [Cytophagales bacterium]|nr:MAG: XRE family transcriptional regulator [Cytophagales bacterium]
MSINDKIKQILVSKGFSPSHFADEIGIQRSSISHILSGRNRPSFDIIQKIIRRFPDLGFDWILEDEPTPSPVFRAQQAPAMPTRRPENGAFQNHLSDNIDRNSRFINRPIRPEVPTDYSTSAEYADDVLLPSGVDASQSKRVERILIFYTDGTFKEYSPTT